MKKISLLMIAVLLHGYLFAQTPLNQHVKERYHFPPQKIQPPKTGAEPLLLNAPPPPSSTRTDGQAAGSVVIGTTVYDLQTNASIGRRLYDYGNGTFSAVWNMGFQSGNGYQDRGTGYNYFNGETWLAEPVVRLESERCGWPSLGVVNGKDYILSHASIPNNHFDQVKSNTIGSGDPSDWTTTLSGASTGSLWPRLAVNGNSLHCISGYQSFTMEIDGVLDPFVYSRSDNNGVTWSTDILLPNYDATRTLGGPDGDKYDIDVNAGKIAIVKGGLGEDVSLWVSTDDGTSWKHTFIDSFEYAPDPLYNAPANVDFLSNDGCVSVLIDDNGQVHVAYDEAMMVVQDYTVAFYPSWIGLRYWTEGMDTAVSIPINVEDIDADGDGIYNIGGTTTDFARYDNSSLLQKPSLSYDASGNVYIVFSLPQDNDISGDEASFRDIWITTRKMSDPVESWSKPFNVTQTFGVEEAFTAVARKSDDCIHLLYQEDFIPGVSTVNGLVDYNNINYLCVDASSITGEAACPIPSNLSSSEITASSVKLKWNEVEEKKKYKLRYKPANSSEWIKIKPVAHHKILTDLLPNTEYAWQVKTVCSSQPALSSDWSVKKFFTTAPLRATVALEENSLEVFPNPMSSSSSVTVKLNASAAVHLALYDVSGKKLATLLDEKLDTGAHSVTIERGMLNAGIYFLHLTTDEGAVVKKIIME